MKRGLIMRKVFTEGVLSPNALRGFATKTYCWCRTKGSLDSGQGVAEYVIILAVIVIACIVLAVLFHEQLVALWEKVTGALEDIT